MAVRRKTREYAAARARYKIFIIDEAHMLTMNAALVPILSAALDAGSNPDNLDFDQRGNGYPRVGGTAADIGAFEVPGAIPDEIFSSGFD